MPALYLFRRRTMLGGDDLQPAAFVTILLRCFQLVFLLGPIFHHIAKESRKMGGFMDYILFDPSDDPSCRHTHYFCLLLVAHAVTSVVYSICTMVLEWRIASWSSRGSPTETEPRTSKVAQLLEYKLIPFSIILFLLWTAGMSAVSFAPSYHHCLYMDDNQKASKYLFKLWWVALALLLLSQIAEVLFAWVYLLHLCKQPQQTFSALGSQYDYDMELPNHELLEEMWADRCAAACRCMSVASCFLFGGRELTGQAEFGDVARALADYLETRGVLDVVPSDIVVGLVVLRQLQKRRVYQARQEVLALSNHQDAMEEGFVDEASHIIHVTTNNNATDDRSGLLMDAAAAAAEVPPPKTSYSQLRTPPSSSLHQSIYRFESDGNIHCEKRSLLDRRNVTDMQALEEAARYSKFALSIYTWVLYLYVHPCSGPARLLAKKGCMCCCDQSFQEMDASSGDTQNGRIKGDNICEAHKTALLLTAGLNEADLVYAQLRSGFRETPYCILLDHSWHSVVVSIRGTLSLEDCVTDVLIEPESLEQLGEEFGFDGKDQYCHGGVLACAWSVYRDLQSHGLLDHLLVGDEALYPDYTLRLVGHSLGAATCTLLSYMLRTKFPTLRCINYSPPGWTMTWEMAVGCKAWCNSFFLDSDLVARLSHDAMERLRDEILELLGRIKVPKIEVVKRAVGRSGLLGCRICWDGLSSSDGLDTYDMAEILYEPDQVPPSTYQQQLQRFQEIQRERRETRGAARSTKLFPPGKMVELKKIGEKRTCVHGVAKCLTCCTTSFGSEYLPVWVNNDDLNEIVVSPTMGIDHFPNRISTVLVSVAQNFGLESS